MYYLLKTSDGSGIGFKSIVIEKAYFFILKNQQKINKDLGKEWRKVMFNSGHKLIFQVFTRSFTTTSST